MRQMSLLMAVIRLPPTYRYLRLRNSITCSGKCVNRLPLRFSSRSWEGRPSTGLVGRKLFGRDSLLRRLFLATSVTRGRWTMASGNCFNLFELRSKTRMFVKTRSCDGRLVRRLWFSSNTSMSLGERIRGCNGLEDPPDSSRSSSISSGDNSNCSRFRRLKSNVRISLASVSLLSDVYTSILRINAGRSSS